MIRSVFEAGLPLLLPVLRQREPAMPKKSRPKGKPGRPRKREKSVDLCVRTDPKLKAVTKSICKAVAGQSPSQNDVMEAALHFGLMAIARVVGTTPTIWSDVKEQIGLCPRKSPTAKQEPDASGS